MQAKFHRDDNAPLNKYPQNYNFEFFRAHFFLDLSCFREAEPKNVLKRPYYDPTDDIEDYLDRQRVLETFYKLLDAYMTSRERDVIIGRIAYDETLQEIGDFYGITRERIRQIEKKALEKMESDYFRKYLVKFDPKIDELEDYLMDLDPSDLENYEDVRIKRQLEQKISKTRNFKSERFDKAVKARKEWTKKKHLLKKKDIKRPYKSGLIKEIIKIEEKIVGAL